MFIKKADVRYLASLYEHSPYVRRFRVEDERGNPLQPLDFKFICPWTDNKEEFYQGSKWTW